MKYVAEEKYQACQFDMYESMHSRMLMPGFIPSVSVYEEEEKVLEMIGPHVNKNIKKIIHESIFF